MEVNWLLYKLLVKAVRINNIFCPFPEYMTWISPEKDVHEIKRRVGYVRYAKHMLDPGNVFRRLRESMAGSGPNGHASSREMIASWFEWQELTNATNVLLFLYIPCIRCKFRYHPTEGSSNVGIFLGQFIFLYDLAVFCYPNN